MQPRVGQSEVHETGTSDFYGSDVVRKVRVDDLGHTSGKLTGIPACGFGGREGNIRRPIAVLAPGRALKMHRFGDRRDLEGRQSRSQGGGEGVANH
ncbi:unannotated protein [freshwater metagenome]|uniref:Unannotated protein n=1 Tax=freshwater metagenome TaxID=449393 RepID=A0A6J6FKU6_9ZZZZ